MAAMRKHLDLTTDSDQDVFAHHLDIAAACAMTRMQGLRLARCGAPLGGVAHLSCNCNMPPIATFCSVGVVRVELRLDGMSADVSLDRLFVVWRQIPDRQAAYRRVQEFVVDVVKAARKGTGVPGYAGVPGPAPRNATKRAGEAPESSAAAEKRAKTGPSGRDNFDAIVISGDSDSD